MLPRADLAAIHALGRRMADAGLERQLPILIQIRLGARLVYVAALPGSTANNERWAERKSRTAALFEQSSLRVGVAHQGDGPDVHARHALPVEQYAAHGGAFPLRTADAGVIGTVVVSGLPQLDDHAFVVEMLEAHIAAH